MTNLHTQQRRDNLANWQMQQTHPNWGLIAAWLVLPSLGWGLVWLTYKLGLWVIQELQ